MSITIPQVQGRYLLGKVPRIIFQYQGDIFMGKKISQRQPAPSLGTTAKSIGSTGNPKGAGSQKSKGGMYPFLPSSYDGAKGSGSGSGQSGSTAKSKTWGFLPEKPE